MPTRNCKFLLEIEENDKNIFYSNLLLRKQIEEKFLSDLLLLGRLPFNGKTLKEIDEERKKLNISAESEEEIKKLFNLIKDKEKVGNSIYAFFTGTKKLKCDSKDKDSLQCLYKLTEANLLPFKFPEGKFLRSIYQSCITQALEKLKSFLNANDKNEKMKEENKPNFEGFTSTELSDLKNLFSVLEKNNSFSFKNFYKNWFRADKVKSKLLSGNFEKIKSLSIEDINTIKLYENILYSSNLDLVSTYLEQLIKSEIIVKEVLELKIDSVKSYRIGSNHEDFELSKDGRDIYLIYNSASGVVKFKILPHKKVRVWDLVTKKQFNSKTGKDTIVTYLAMQRPSDIKTYFYKKSEIIFNIKNGQIFANLPREFEMTRKGCYFFKTSLNTKIKDEAKELINDMKISFVDLGLNPIYSISTYSYKKNDNNGDIRVIENENKDFGSASLIDTFQLKSNDQTLERRLNSLIGDVSLIKKSLSIYKKISDFNENGFKRKLKSSLKEFDFISSLEDSLKSILSIQDFYNYSESNFELAYKNILDKFNLITKEISKIKRERNFSFHKNETHICAGFSWLKLLKIVLDVKKSLSYLNTKFEKGQKPKYSFTKDRTYLNNFSENYAKILASIIKKYCYENNVNVVVFEQNLENFKTSIFNDKETNKLLMNWANRNLFKRIEMSLNELDIDVDVVDGRHSSQLDPETMEFGVRDTAFGHGDKTKIYFKRNGNLIQEDADLSASKVLAKRYFTRNKDICFTYIDKKIKKDGSVVNLILSENKKIIPSYLNLKVGSNYAIINSNGKLEAITVSDYKTLLSLKSKPRTDNNSNKMYRHEEIWYSYDEHKNIQKEFLSRGRLSQKTALPLAG